MLAQRQSEYYGSSLHSVVDQSFPSIFVVSWGGESTYSFFSRDTSSKENGDIGSGGLEDAQSKNKVNEKYCN